MSPALPLLLAPPPTFKWKLPPCQLVGVVLTHVSAWPLVSLTIRSHSSSVKNLQNKSQGEGTLWKEGEGMLWKEGVEGGDMTVGECRVAEVMELVELPQVLVEVKLH